MEKDETVGESSPHIANIGRLVEVRIISNTVHVAKYTWSTNVLSDINQGRKQVELIFIFVSGYGEQDSLHTE